MGNIFFVWKFKHAFCVWYVLCSKTWQDIFTFIVIALTLREVISLCERMWEKEYFYRVIWSIGDFDKTLWEINFRYNFCHCIEVYNSFSPNWNHFYRMSSTLMRKKETNVGNDCTASSSTKRYPPYITHYALPVLVIIIRIPA